MNYYVLELTLADESLSSPINIVDHNGQVVVTINFFEDSDTNGRQGIGVSGIRKFSKLFKSSSLDNLKVEDSNVTANINVRPATRAEMLASPDYTFEFRNESGLDFQDISSEAERTYNFGGKGFVKISNPLKLNVSASGGHRLFTADGRSHYVPAGWVQLTWVTKADQPHFVK